jgi:hypothetical protein
MNDRKTIIDYITQVLSLFGFTMIIMMSFSLLFGESAKGYTTLFANGKAGVSAEVMVQFLVLSLINVFIRFLFLSDRIIKEMLITIRIVLTLMAVLISISIFIIIFGWFPIHMWQPWTLFVGSFLMCSAIGTFITSAQNKMENKKLAEGLANLREQWGDENGTED